MRNELALLINPANAGCNRREVYLSLELSCLYRKIPGIPQLVRRSLRTTNANVKVG